MYCRAMSIAGESFRPLFARVLHTLTDPAQERRKLSAPETRQLYLVCPCVQLWLYQPV